MRLLKQKTKKKGVKEKKEKALLISHLETFSFYIYSFFPTEEVTTSRNRKRKKKQGGNEVKSRKGKKNVTKRGK